MSSAQNRIVLVAAVSVATGTLAFMLFAPGFDIASEDLNIASQTTVIGPLSPGTGVPIDLRLNNPHHFNLAVSNLTVAIDHLEAPQSDADSPCTAHDFIVSQLSRTTPLIVPAQESPTLSSLGLPRESWPRVEMRDTNANQDGCKGAHITLEYSGIGTAELP
ncbi:hypothetical protein [Cryobacterium sp. PH29-G1]|uniref:hypothetical protein n=1 Tax=Cryobacterium sp. PH29-G1 TaxID=3046211 RepID=UPI0024B940BF|nr:hypothetical protein [Cryobacterium sp. PH29-G1]MDJ0347943.1 hypothetical protein [Cryobacterium sp. PH29-G1]